MNRVIRRKLMEAKRPPTSIKQWYECTTNLDKHWRESRRKKKKIRGSTPRANNGRVQRQQLHQS